MNRPRLRFVDDDDWFCLRYLVRRCGCGGGDAAPGEPTRHESSQHRLDNTVDLGTRCSASRPRPRHRRGRHSSGSPSWIRSSLLVCGGAAAAFIESRLTTAVAYGKCIANEYLHTKLHPNAYRRSRAMEGGGGGSARAHAQLCPTHDLRKTQL